MEVVRRIHEAWSAGEKATGLIAHDVVYVNPPNAVETGTKQGPEMFDRVNDVYDEFLPRVERLLDVGDRVVVIVSGRSRTRTTGVEIPIRQGYVWTVRDGKAVRFEWFSSPEEALAAVGFQASDTAMSG
jgi:ketosteroid isomerase-like protein